MNSASYVVERAEARTDAREGRLVLLFFVSGIAALIYQVCWQRLLFEAFGVDMESVTIIVSTFMLGLGLGALVGGQSSKPLYYEYNALLPPPGLTPDECCRRLTSL